MRKILLSHHVTSPLILGIATSNGFGSNADELKNSYILYENMTLRPYREMLIDAFDNILGFNGVHLNLYFDSLKPLEFTDPLGQLVVDDEEQKKLSKEVKKFNASDYGHTKEKNWVLIDSFDVDMDKEAEIDKELLEAQKTADKHIEEEKLSRNTKLSKLQKIKKMNYQKEFKRTQIKFILFKMQKKEYRLKKEIQNLFLKVKMGIFVQVKMLLL